MESINYKQIAIDFLQLASKGLSSEAFGSYIGKKFKHHNINFKGDAESLMIAMEESATQFPDKAFNIKRILQDGELVAVHSHVVLKKGDPGIALIHIFRFESEKIVELWDFGQTIPSKTVNENGMF